ncbi:MAG: radical SAM protein, partial [Gemmatimonadota bacterium]
MREAAADAGDARVGAVESPLAPAWEERIGATGATARGTDEPPIPHVVAWNLTRRCNLACAHCYISAGAWHAGAEELPTGRCLAIVDQLLEVNPALLLILSGGEPLVRTDLETIAAHAARGGATVVVGSNGTGLTDDRIASLQEAGVQGVALSVDSLDPRY